MTSDTVGDRIVLSYDPDAMDWTARSELYDMGVIVDRDPLAAVARYLSRSGAPTPASIGLPRAAEMQRAALLLDEAAKGLRDEADEILNRCETIGVTEEGGYRLRVHETTRRTRLLDVPRFADAHPAEFRALATVPLGAADKLLGRTEVDQFCDVEEQTTRKRTVERIAGGDE